MANGKKIIVWNAFRHGDTAFGRCFHGVVSGRDFLDAAKQVRFKNQQRDGDGSFCQIRGNHSLPFQ